MNRTFMLGILVWWVVMTPTAIGAQSEPVSEASPQGAEVRFRVTELRNDKGALICGLFNREGWLQDGTPGEGGEIKDGEAACLFREIPPGTYGISAYHDQNGNGELDSNFLRIPKEGTTASNDARGKMGPPKFEDAKFDVDGGVHELEASMHYR